MGIHGGENAPLRAHPHSHAAPKVNSASISLEQRVSVDAKLKCGRGWAWGQFPAYVLRRLPGTRKSIAKPRSADYPKIAATYKAALLNYAYWNLETTKTTFKNNIALRAHLEHSESWQFEDRQMGAGELDRAHKASCFQKVVSNNEKNGGESSNAPVMTLGRRTNSISR